jgi:hypothetical protein
MNISLQQALSSGKRIQGVCGHTSTMRPLTIRSRPAHCPLTIRSRPAHCPLTIPSRPAHCPLTIPSRPAHCPLPIPSRPAHCPLTIPSRSAHCTLTIPSGPAHCPLTILARTNLRKKLICLHWKAYVRDRTVSWTHPLVWICSSEISALIIKPQCDISSENFRTINNPVTWLSEQTVEVGIKPVAYRAL